MNTDFFMEGKKNLCFLCFLCAFVAKFLTVPNVEKEVLKWLG